MGQFHQPNELSYQPSSQACIVDLTPPTFAGITSASAQANGSIQFTWPAATDATNPIGYELYIATGSITAVSLFSTLANVVYMARPTGSAPFSSKVFTLPTGTYLTNAQIYTCGVRAVDAVGNRESNLVIATATSAGVVPDCFSAALSTLTGLNSSLSVTDTGLAVSAASIAASAAILASAATNDAKGYISGTVIAQGSIITDPKLVGYVSNL